MIFRTLSLALLLIFWAGLSYAEFTLTKGVGLRLEYDDNIYLDPDGEEEDDFIATVAPNFSITWETRYFRSSLHGGVTFEKYLDHTEEDQISPTLGQPTELDFLFNLYREVFLLTITDTFSQQVIDERERGGEGNTIVNLTNSNRLRINPYLQFQPTSDTRMQLGYTYENLWYSDSDGDDADSHIFSATLSQALSSRIVMSLNGAYTLYRPKDVAREESSEDYGAIEYDLKEASIGLTYQASERLTMRAQFGRSWYDYDVRSDSDSNTWSAGADYQITSDYTAGVSYNKSFSVSVENGPYKSDQLMAYLDYQKRFSLRAEAFTNLDNREYVEQNRAEDYYGGMISGELPFNDKVGISGLFRYTRFEQFRPVQENYDRYSTSFSIYRAIRLGRLSAGHTYNRNNSNLDADDYTSNILFVAATLNF